MKRYRPVNAKRGQLKVGWGKDPHNPPELQYAYNGPAHMKRDNNMLMMAFNGELRQSFIAELEARGYDLTTLKFSIELKPENLPPKPENV